MASGRDESHYFRTTTVLILIQDISLSSSVYSLLMRANITTFFRVPICDVVAVRI